MLDFETCKRLKEAGFPQIQSTFMIAYTLDDNGGHSMPLTYAQMKKPLGDIEWIYIPSIEYLLRELGEKRGDEGLILVWDRQWKAGYTRYFDVGYSEPDRYGNPHGVGTTPELALANLYLTLHSKSEVTDYGHDGK